MRVAEVELTIFYKIFYTPKPAWLMGLLIFYKDGVTICYTISKVEFSAIRFFIGVVEGILFLGNGFWNFLE